MTDRPFRKDSREAGNILLYVLIGVALFGALMFIISRDNRYDTGSTEEAAINAQQITSYANKVNSAVQSIIMQNHCLPSQISFQTPTTGGACMVFDQTGVGGGLVYQTPPARAVDTASAAAAGSGLAGNYYFEGNVCVEGMGTGPEPANGSSCSATTAELIFVMPWVTQSVCAAINWITMKSMTIPTVSAASFNGTSYTGTYAGTYTLNTAVAPGGISYPSGCYYSTASPPGTGYHFYEVLIAN